MALLSHRGLSQLALGLRGLSTVRLSDNLALLTVSEVPARGVSPEHVLRHTADQPVAIMLPWLGATQKGIRKYADFYLSQGFNVLVGTVTARQLLLPESGAQVAARQLVDVLLANDDVSQYVVHGFSIGAYYWGEVLGQMAWMDPGRTITRKITGLVFDSPADITEIPVGLSMAVTDNVLLQKMIAAYAKFHLKTMEKLATRHYREAKRQFVHYPLEDATAVMFLWSQNDPVCCCEAILDAGAEHEKHGRKVFYKCWPDSKHVRHLIQHPGDYHWEVSEFFKHLGHLRFPDRFPAHRQAAAVSQ
ncbi:uncharacterized protein LOC119108607 [Pollicipes pollicipes]|uniref:uncharacterized protein LOC119108607 n=1 Tax=Pollicipes pollicipes TaxID=41117 RepID=UPI0018858EB4|nr:uncharacterized protein LOC119108607 [Pollicipes pollicipes]